MRIILQLTDNQTLGGAFLGVEGDIYYKAAKQMKRVITGIYAITNPLGQSYIGQSVNIHRRWTNYRSKSGLAKQPKLRRSAEAFGLNNHSFTILTQCEADFLYELESHYKWEFIKENGWDNALFCKLDDDVPAGKRKRSVKQYSLNGELIACFETATEAGLAVGGENSAVISCCKQKHGARSYKGFQWRYAEDEAPLPMKKNYNFIGRAVKVFTRDGEFVADYKSASSAAEAMGIRERGIARQARGERRHYKGFIFKWA